MITKQSPNAPSHRSSRRPPYGPWWAVLRTEPAPKCELVAIARAVRSVVETLEGRRLTGTLTSTHSPAL
jgi:hypothetical protein